MAREISFRTILILTLIVFGLVLAYRFVSFSVSPDGCRFFDAGVDCGVLDALDPLDINIFVTICISLLALAMRSMGVGRFTRINSETKRMMTDMRRISEDYEETRERRVTYAVGAIKNHMGSLLLCVGIASRITKSGARTAQLDEIYSDAEDIVAKIRHVLRLSVDVLDPELMHKAESVVTAVEQGAKSDTKDLIVDYEALKKNVISLSKQLSEYKIQMIR